LTPSSTSLDLGAAATGAQLTGEVTLTDTGSTNLTVGAVRTPSAPFEATGLPKEGAVIEKGQTITVHVTFRSAAPGHFAGSLGLSTAAGETDVALSASAEAPPPAEESTTPHEPGAAATTASLTTPAPNPLATPIAEPLVSLTHLHLGHPASRRARGRHEIRLTYTLSAAGTVEVAIDRRVLSHRCLRGGRTCIHDVPTTIGLKVAGHVGRNVLTVNLAGLSAGSYRSAATPITQSGTAGITRYVDFKVVR
jgi:hypothetical protein